MTALKEILAWSETVAPSWMREALRRIVVQAEFTETDVEDLAELCKKTYGLSATKSEVCPLTANDLPTAADSLAVSLLSLTHVSDVNALAPNETIAFGKTGLTVIFGNNGAGKSGYTRILKRACRARGSNDPILANAISEKPAGTPTARLGLAIGDAQSEHMWKDGTTSSSELSAVSVFDSAAAQVYVSDKTEVKFRPFGLDVLDKLATVCVQVKARLDREKEHLETSAVVLPAVPMDTQAGKLLAALTALTKREDVDLVALLSVDEETERGNLAGALALAKSEDPIKKSTDLKNKAARLRRLVAEMRGLSQSLGSVAVDQLVALRGGAKTASEAAQKVALGVAGVGSLAGLGEKSWRQLWEAADAYSASHAYPTHSFPHLVDDALCVLCQQQMDQPTRERMAKFRDFVKGEAQKAVATKQMAVDLAQKVCVAIEPGKNVKDALDDLAMLDTSLSQTVSAFLADAERSRSSILESVDAPLSVSIAPPIDQVEQLATKLEAQATEMTRAANPVERARIEGRLKELQARHALAAVRPQIYVEIDRLARLNAYERSIKDTETRAITKLSTELTKKFVTDTLTAAFDDELMRLGFRTLEIELRSAGAQKGVLYHQIVLKHATKAQLPKIVSEGEGRCIALAAFLAEVRGASVSSTIVFDDPVSSLDHTWRSSVAKRLVEESKVRQVIVFTHEMVFLAALLQEADQQGAIYSTQTLARGGDSLAGCVEQGLPWVGLSTQKRIKALKDRWQKADTVHRTQGTTEYEPMATRLYADIRRTWERAVEEVLLNGTVMRFRQSVETQKLRKVSDITEADLQTVEAGMTKSSKWEGGHDQAIAVNEPLPAPAELKSDLDQLEQWVDGIEKRRKK